MTQRRNDTAIGIAVANVIRRSDLVFHEVERGRRVAFVITIPKDDPRGDCRVLRRGDPVDDAGRLTPPGKAWCFGRLVECPDPVLTASQRVLLWWVGWASRHWDGFRGGNLETLRILVSVGLIEPVHGEVIDADCCLPGGWDEDNVLRDGTADGHRITELGAAVFSRLGERRRPGKRPA